MSNFRQALAEKRNRARKTEVVTVPEFDVPLTLRELRRGDMKDADGDITNYVDLLLPRMIINDEGEREFSDDDHSLLDELSIESFGLLMKAAAKLNGVSEEAVKEAIKNSKANLKIDSPTD